MSETRDSRAPMETMRVRRPPPADDVGRLPWATLDALPAAVAILDARGRLLRANRAATAILGERAAAAFERWFGERARGLLARLDAEDAPLDVQRVGGRRYALRLAALSTPRGEPPVALLAIAELGAAPLLAPEDIVAAFGMTRAEAAVAMALAQGRSLEEQAKSGPSLSTIRLHLHRCFRKTATTRQADLVRVLLTLPPRAMAKGE